MSAWQLANLHVAYRSGPPWRPTQHDVLRGASLSVAAGERIGLIGASGAGKTTLIRAGLGLVPHDRGQVHLLGEDTAGWSARRWRASRHHAQLLFQSPRAMLHPTMPLARLLRESARLHRPEESAGKAVAEVLEAVGLRGRDHARAHELSGGERRRAGIARLLLAKPRLVVADELTAGLDASLKAEIVELLLDRVGPECAVVLVSHDLPLLTWSVDRIAVVDGGQVVESCDPAALASADRHPATRKLARDAGLEDA
ncbi:MAG: ATP-binding cassette domain-containing protein [Deltaproteobacteria bacterium]|nr:MAG: ATP-binding cassette domain-containing protein [Deltaproteobacteria bacterium]